jgi:hypothetical protein
MTNAKTAALAPDPAVPASSPAVLSADCGSGQHNNKQENANSNKQQFNSAFIAYAGIYACIL